jgi:hypothetical protein
MNKDKHSRSLRGGIAMETQSYASCRRLKAWCNSNIAQKILLRHVAENLAERSVKDSWAAVKRDRMVARIHQANLRSLAKAKA